MEFKKTTLLVYLLITSHIFAWQPSGWVYQMGDYRYEYESGDWYWKMNWDYWNVNLSTGEWTNSSANGWNYYTWPYFYSTSIGHWHFASDPGSEADIVNLSTGNWSKFGIGTQTGDTNFDDVDESSEANTTVTVTLGADTNNGRPIGVFYFDGVEKAVLEFKKETKYTFIQNDFSNATYASIHHPLMFSTGDDGAHNDHGHYMAGVVYKLDGITKTMAEYVNGFVTASDRRVEWTVPSDAPSTLHYWCHFHSGQGAAMTVTN